MKVKLLNDGGYSELSCLQYPVIVEGRADKDGDGAWVSGAELEAAGADDGSVDIVSDYFFTNDECEI